MQNYNLYIKLSEKEVKQLENDKQFIIEDHAYDNKKYNLTIDSIEEAPLRGLKVPANDLKKFIKAFKIPFTNRSSLNQAIKTFIIYLYLAPSKISIFFIRGWRLQIIKNMVAATKREVAIAPKINRLYHIGSYIKEGVLLIGAKLIYDLPKILILTAIAYHYIEFILDWVMFIFGNFLGQEDTSLSNMIDDTQAKVSITLFVQFIFILIYSFIITPVYKINEIKYSSSIISYSDFFKLSEIKDSFQKYKNYKVSTIQVYSWDLFISILSFVFGFGFLILFPWLYLFVMPFYKLYFKHWPKAYGYGELARRMQANDDL